MKKHLQLGMNAGTASHRLVKDLLFQFVKNTGHVCYRCQRQLTRDDFSIEHVKPWLDSEDPVRLFFDLENIAYSHRLCNTGAARRPNKTCDTPEERKARDADIERVRWKALPKEEQQRIRREKYARNGC